MRRAPSYVVDADRGAVADARHRCVSNATSTVASTTSVSSSTTRVRAAALAASRTALGSRYIPRMDDATATVFAALIGAGAAIVIGLIGALAGALPVWSLEKRQAKKESRDEVRRLLALLLEELLDYASRVSTWSGAQASERGMHLISLSAQLGLVLRPRDAPVLRHATAAVRLVVTRDGYGMTQAVRVDVAATVAQDLPDWFRGTMSASSLQVDAIRWENQSAKILDKRTEVESKPTVAPEA